MNSMLDMTLFGAAWDEVTECLNASVWYSETEYSVKSGAVTLCSSGVHTKEEEEIHLNQILPLFVLNAWFVLYYSLLKGINN